MSSTTHRNACRSIEIWFSKQRPMYSIIEHFTRLIAHGALSTGIQVRLAGHSKTGNKQRVPLHGYRFIHYLPRKTRGRHSFKGLTLLYQRAYIARFDSADQQGTVCFPSVFFLIPISLKWQSSKTSLSLFFADSHRALSLFLSSACPIPIAQQGKKREKKQNSRLGRQLSFISPATMTNVDWPSTSARSSSFYLSLAFVFLCTVRLPQI